jgi:protein tyrosine/serine phosphatase
MFIVNDYISRGPRLNPEDYDYLRKLGYTHILNLEDSSEAVKAELSAAEKVGIEVILIPMSEWTRPTTDQLILSMRYIRTLFPQMQVKSGVNLIAIPNVKPGKRLYAHCKHGKDRTGEFVALERMIFDNWSYEASRDEMIKYGHAWYLYWFWGKSILEAYNLLVRGT